MIFAYVPNCFSNLQVIILHLELHKISVAGTDFAYIPIVGEPKAIPWTNVSPLKAAADAWCHMDIQRGDIVAWPTNLGWMMGPWLVYASLLNGGSMALYNGSPLGSGFAKFVQVCNLILQ